MDTAAQQKNSPALDLRRQQSIKARTRSVNGNLNNRSILVIGEREDEEDRKGDGQNVVPPRVA